MEVWISVRRLISWERFPLLISQFSCSRARRAPRRSLYLEVSPSVIGFLAIAVARLKFLTKEGFSVGNLFSGLKEMFLNIKQSFKEPE